MKKVFLKSMLLLCALIVGSTSLWAAEVTFSIATYADDQSWENETAYTSTIAINSDLSLSCVSGGNNGKYYSSNESWRHYEGDNGSITITTSSGTLNSITFTYGKNNNGVLIYDETNYSSGTECEEVLGETTATFTVGHSSGTKNGNVQITSIVIDYTPAGGGSGSSVSAPSFTIGTGTYSSTQTVKVSGYDSDLMYFYTTDGTDPDCDGNLDPTGNSIAYDNTTGVSISTTTTLKMIAVDGDVNKSSVTRATYTFAELYNLATSITSGKHYVIANSTSNGSALIMGAQSSNNRSTSEATISSSVLSAVSAREFIIYGPDADGLYVIYDPTDKKYLYAASSSSNHLKSQTDIDNNARWEITFNGTTKVASIQAIKSSNRKVMQYNGSLVSCYASANQSAVYLYEKDGEAAASETVTTNSLGWSTFSSINALDLSGANNITAYIVKGVSESVLILQSVSGIIPARTGLLISGTVDETFDVASATNSNTEIVDVSDNMLVMGKNSEKVKYNDITGSDLYVLVANSAGTAAEFQKIISGKPASVQIGKAYLAVPTGGGTAPSIIRIEDEENNATNIETIESSDKAVKFFKNGQLLIKRDGVVYDAMGRIIR